MGPECASSGDNVRVSSAPHRQATPGHAIDRAAARPPSDQRFHVCVVCSGNICRSPIGEQVLRAAIAQAGLADQVRVSSAGTGGWHIGQGANSRAVRVLREAGFATDHRARQITRAELADIDLVLAADRGHLRELRTMTTEPDKVVLLRSFDPDAEHDEVPDPYFGPDAGFDEVLAMTRAAAPFVVDDIRRRLGHSTR
jgi:protein-tyrosine phosphatase